MAICSERKRSRHIVRARKFDGRQVDFRRCVIKSEKLYSAWLRSRSNSAKNMNARA